MTLDELRILAAALVPQDMHWEIEPYRLNEHETQCYYRIRPDRQRIPDGFHIDIQAGVRIETIWLCTDQQTRWAKAEITKAIERLRVTIRVDAIELAAREREMQTAMQIKAMGLLH